MTIRVTTDVFCDLCNNWFHGIVDTKKQTEWARDLARDAGWSQKRQEGRLIDICPECADGYEGTNDANV